MIKKTFRLVLAAFTQLEAVSAFFTPIGFVISEWFVTLDFVSSSPRVTVITPAYNVAAFIEETISCVKAQTFQDFEYIVVDDESTDGTAALAEAAVADFPNARVIRAPHGGSSAARNVAIKVAKGEYISFIDGDDTWSPTKLEKQVKLLDSLNDRVGGVFCASKIISESGTPMWGQMAPRREYDFDDFLAWYSPPRNGSSLTVRKSIFDDAGLFDESLKGAVDFDMWLRVGKYSKSPLFYGTRDILVGYRRRAGSVTQDLSKHMANVDVMLDKYSALMERLPRGAAYVRPALYALSKGSGPEAEYAEKWKALGLSTGTRYLLSNSGGRRLLIWKLAGKNGGKAARLFRKVAYALISGAAEKGASVISRTRSVESPKKAA